MHKRQWEFARRHFEEARKVFQLLRWKRMESSVLRNIGLGLRLQGDLNKSLRLVEEAGRLLEGPDPNRTAHAAFLLADRALIEFGLGRYRESGRTIAGCEKLARARRWHLGRLYGRLVRALIALKTGRKKAARDLVNGLFDLAREKGYHGILGLELRHQPELLSFVRGLPGHRAYLDRFPRYYAAEPPGLFLRFFGRMRIEDADRNELRPAWPTEKARSLFAFLVLNRARNLTRDEVLDALWPGSKRTRAQENLRTTAYRMRRALAQIKTSGPDKDAPFSRRQGRYFLLPDLAIESDVDEHDRLMKLCDMTRSEDEQVSLLKQLAEAGREPLLPDIYDGWADARRSAFREQRLKVLGRIIAILSRRNDHSACAGYCAQYLKLEPLSEETAHTLMFSLKNLGRISEVKKAYQALARKLREELKCPPAPETKRFYRELLK
jgi:DNA-binding SARP family transcriptional activator